MKAFFVSSVSIVLTDSRQLKQRQIAPGLDPDLNYEVMLEISDAVGLQGFREVENRVNASIDAENTVIATGGSVIYGPEAMAHLRDISHVVYLRLSYPAIEARLGDLHARGVSIAPGQSLLDLYNERCPLYEKYAHFAVDCEGLRPREIAAIILERTGRDAPGLFAPSDSAE